MHPSTCKQECSTRHLDLLLRVRVGLGWVGLAVQLHLVVALHSNVMTHACAVTAVYVCSQARSYTNHRVKQSSSRSLCPPLSLSLSLSAVACHWSALWVMSKVTGHSKSTRKLDAKKLYMRARIKTSTRKLD